MRPTYSRHQRNAYTLVEVMVALGLSVLTMWILAEAFRVGLEMIGQSRAQANLMTQLGAVGAVLHRDLVYAHPFLPDDRRPNRGMRLSDQRLDLSVTGGWTEPHGGFFRIISQPPSTSVSDSEGWNIYTCINHALHFTAILPERETQLFRTIISSGTVVQVYESRAAEVAYFLVDTQVNTPGGNRLYNLVRRQRLVAMTPGDVTRLSTNSAADYFCDLIACKVVSPGSPTTAYNLSDVRHPGNRLPISPTMPLPWPITNPLTSPRPIFPPIPSSATDPAGEEILLPNVLSFEVLVHWVPPPGLVSLVPPITSDAPYAFLPSPYVFDTNSYPPMAASAPPLPIRVLGLRVSIRVYDPKTRTTRQNTWQFAL
jgi:hypothetical protein